MNFKHCICILLAVFILLLPSCLGGNDDEEITYPKDAQLTSFQLTHDSIADLGKVSFTIDQLNSYVYNVDSLTYGLDIPEKAILNFSTAGYSVVLLNEAQEDSTALSSGDSISIAPFINQKTPYLRVYAYDGSKKDYFIDLRAHTIDPDSMVYVKLGETLPAVDEQKTVWLNGRFYCVATTGGNASLYRSTDAQNWESVAAAGFPSNAAPASLNLYGERLVSLSSDGKLYFANGDGSSWQALSTGETVSAILGETKELPPSGASVLALLVESGGKLVFAQTDLSEVIKGDDIPASFPVKEFASLSWTNETNQSSTILIVGGLSEDGQPSTQIWRNSAGDGLAWTSSVPKVYKGGEPFEVPYLSPNLIRYDNKVFLMNGRDGAAYLDKLYASVDGGLTWEEMPAKYSPLSDYERRNNASVCVDADHYMYVLGGQNAVGVLRDVWKARLNRLGF